MTRRRGAPGSATQMEMMMMMRRRASAFYFPPQVLSWVYSDGFPGLDVLTHMYHLPTAIGI